MPGDIYLLGGPEFSAPYAELDTRLVAEAGSTSITFVPTAAAYERPQRRIDTARERAVELGAELDVIEVYGRSDAMEQANADRIAAARLIYLADGSTMHVESTWKRSSFWTGLRTAHESGATIVAAGASGRVLCDPMVDPRGGAFAVGLGLIESIAFVPLSDQWTEDRERRTRSLLPDGVTLEVVPAGEFLHIAG